MKLRLKYGLLTALVAVMALFAEGCDTIKGRAELPVDQALPSAVQEAQRLIHDTHLNIAAAAATIRVNRKAGLLTAEQQDKYLDNLEVIRQGVVDIQALINKGLYDSAIDKVKLQKRALEILQIEVAKQIAKEEAARKAGTR